VSSELELEELKPDTTTNPRGKERRKEDVWNKSLLPREVMPPPTASIAVAARGPISPLF
jgi:hypothetical protein